MRGSLYIFRLREYLVHIGSISLLRTVLNGSHSNAERLRSEANLDDITELDIVGCLRNTAVDGNVRGIACIVCNRSALDDARYLQILIKPHCDIPNLSR